MLKSYKFDAILAVIMNFFWKGINTFHDSSGFRTRIVGWSNSCAIASSNNPPYSQFTATMHNCGCEGLYSCLKVCRSAAQVGWMRRRRGLISGQRSTFSLCTIPLSPRRHLRRSVRDAARGGSGGGDGVRGEGGGEGGGSMVSFPPSHSHALHCKFFVVSDDDSV